MHNRHYEKFADGTVKDIEDEIPFEVPEGWEWCRLKNICLEFIVPQRDKPTTFDGNIPWCRIEDIEGKYLNGSLSNQLVSMETIKKMNMHICPKGSIICSCSASLGVQAIVTVDCCTNQTFIGIVPKHEVLFNEYLYYFLGAQTKYFNEIATGTTIKYISRDKFENLLFPLPPIMEQEKTVSAIEHYFSLINAIENDKSDLQTAIKQAKFKILDLAIHGKLVPQDSSDEPASVLLERLRAEKEAKIKAGELKRDKNDSYIYKNTTDNCYYEKFADGTEEQVEPPAIVPESWVWCHFGDVADVINGKNQSKVEDESGIYPIYGSGGIMGRANDYICPENCTIIGRKGSINNPIFVEEKFWNVDTAFGLAPSTGVLPKYLFYFCKSFNFTSLDSSTTLPSLTKTNIQQILFPLPSLSEQQRILNKVESLFKKLDEIVLNLI